MVVVLAVAVRMILAGPRHNWDFDSYLIVAGIMRRGANVYAETSRYNYGPIWFWLLHVLDVMSQWFSKPLVVFRLEIAALLSLVDLAIFAVLWRRYDRTRAMAALLSPIAILITGYHGQFDNLALLFGMLAVLVYESDKNADPGRFGITERRAAAYLLLGLSLMTKHFLFLFPFWIAIRERSWRARIWAVAIPSAVFLSGFLPYFAEGRAGIVAHVFQYRSYANAPLLNAVFAPLVKVANPMELFILSLVISGYLTRRWRPMDALLMYTLVLVSFAPATANQYLAIVVPAIAVFSNLPFLLYTLIATLVLIGDDSGLLIQIRFILPETVDRWLVSPDVYQLPVVVLAIGTFWAGFGTELTARFRQRTALKGARPRAS